MKLLLLSNSKNPKRAYLEHALPLMLKMLEGKKRVLFIPFAGVGISWDAYTEKVADALEYLGIEVLGIHQCESARDALSAAEAIAVGGGNTFVLLNQLYRSGLLDVLREAVSSGVPYMGWSAGSNIAGPGIHTTNDMPIVYPPSFEALNLIDFQINPHYTEETLPNFNGETRLQRINEFLELNRERSVIGLPEGSALAITDGHIEILDGPVALFTHGKERLWCDQL